MYNEFTANSQAPIFGVQASWLCFCKNGCRRGVPDNADIAFLYLQTYQTRAQRRFKQLTDSGMKKADALKECSTIENGNDELTRLQCPALDFDEEGPFKDIFSMFIQTADQKAVDISGIEFSREESCVTTAWIGEDRAIICKQGL